MRIKWVRVCTFNIPRCFAVAAIAAVCLTRTVRCPANRQKKKGNEGIWKRCLFVAGSEGIVLHSASCGAKFLKLHVVTVATRTPLWTDTRLQQKNFVESSLDALAQLRPVFSTGMRQAGVKREGWLIGWGCASLNEHSGIHVAVAFFSYFRDSFDTLILCRVLLW